MPAPDRILALVDRFDRNRKEYTGDAYNETLVRQDFLNPLFAAFGWDMDNAKGRSERYREVVHEYQLKVRGENRAPDYCFRIGANPVFFVEAKKPAVDIGHSIDPAYQLRRYAWSAKLPLSILTDFEEFSVYDCRFKPDKGDKASAGRIIYLNYQQYGEQWDELVRLFSPEGIQQGHFDRFAEQKAGKRGTAEVDDEFLAEIERWRELLARNIILRNPAVGSRGINYAVQQIIDRIIFLRICEARDIEAYGTLLGLTNGPHLYDRLQFLFRQADQRYNSGLFHFEAEKGRAEAPDTLTPTLSIDDKVLKDLIGHLYYPDSPYEFAVLPADILGHVYERFLGKVIRLTPGRQVKIEEKPEVRKAGGVYYTPTYIVEYIVRQTVGRLVEGRTPAQVSRLRVVDPACGSGSFLLGAYQFLLDWHLAQYALDPEKWAAGRRPAIVQGNGGDWRLTIEERKRILMNNLYGVDIDPQAVEVTKLSLLMRVLEGEGVKHQLALFPERVLPDLGRNIRCGNSLIGPDFYDGRLDLPDEETAVRVNAFDWVKEFPEATATGGFDAVIGNPPYIRIQALQEWAPLEVEHYKRRYKSASKGNYDIYVVFVEKGLSLLNERGLLGFILPHKFFNAQYGEPVRAVLSAGRHLSKVVHFGDQQVFEGATTYTCLLFLEKGGRNEFSFVRAHDLAAWRAGDPQVEGTIPATKAGASEWNFVVGRGGDLFDRLREMPVKLGDVAERMAQGIRTSANEVYVLDYVAGGPGPITAHSAQLQRDVVLESELLSPFLLGRNIKAYTIGYSGKLVLMPYRVEGQRAQLIPESELARSYPLTYSYLKQNRQHLEGRENGKMRGPNWYGYVYPKNLEIMRSSKILVPDIADRAAFAFDPSGQYCLTSGYAVTLRQDHRQADLYYLGLLNSGVLNFYLKRVSTPMRGGFFRYFTQFIEQLPIRTIDFDDPADVRRHDRMVALVTQMLDLHKRLAVEGVPQVKDALQRQIDVADRQIDQLVYELYGLSEAEIATVEDAAAPSVRAG